MKEAGCGVAKVRDVFALQNAGTALGRRLGRWRLGAKGRVYVETLLQNTDDFHVMTADLLIENDLTTLWECSIASSDFITWFTDIGIFRKQPK